MSNGGKTKAQLIDEAEALRQSEMRYRLVAENATNIVWTMGMDMRFSYVSPSVRRVLGYSVETAMNGTLGHFLTPASQELALEALAKWLAIDKERKGQELSPVELELEHLRKDGSIALCEVTANFLRDKDNRPLGIVGVTRDISERKRAEEEARRVSEYYQNLVGSAEDAILASDMDQRLTTWNLGAERLYGYTADEALGRRPGELLGGPDRTQEIDEVVSQTLADGKTRTFEAERYRKNGEKVNVVVTLSALRDSDGNIIGASAINKDITVRRRLEKEVVETKEFLENLIATAGDAIICVNRDGIISVWNRAAERLYGYAGDEAIGKSFVSLIVPDHKRKEASVISRYLDRGETIQDFETQRKRKDGSVFWVSISRAPLLDKEGKRTWGIGIHKDITERKLAEQEILKTKEYYENLVGNAGDAILAVDNEFRMTTWNTGAEKLYGYSRDEVLGRRPGELLGGPDRTQEIDEVVSKTLADGKTRTFEAERYKKDGEKVNVVVTLSALRDRDGNIIGASAINKDITVRRRLEKEVIETKEFMESLIATAGDAIVCTDRDCVLTVWNPAAERLYGYTAEEALGKPFTSLYVPEEMKEEAEGLVRRLDRGGVTQHYETQRMRKGGSLVWVSISNAPLFDRDGRRVGGIGIHKDISQHKRAEQEIFETKEFLENLVGSAGDAIIAVDRELNITVWNIGAERIFGYSREEALGQCICHLIGGADKAEEIKQIACRVLAGESVGPYEVKRYRKDGNVVWGFVSTSPLRDSDGEAIGISVVFKDMTEEKRIREQLTQAEKMSSLGELISGVAHELNNPLTSVIGFPQLSLLQPHLSPKVRTNLEKVAAEAERAARIVQNLLTFARQRKPEKQTVSINSLLRQTLDLRSYQLMVKNIEVVEKLDAQLPETVADRYQLQQVFLNAVTNAEQAMAEAHGRGTLTVRTSQRQDAEGELWIRVQIKDDGPGIPEEHLSRIFDPFFTTKQEGGGTGLGLSICYGIVQEHGGRISVQSKLGRGANFIVDLPLVQPKVEMPEAKGAGIIHIPSGKSVLIVDDEEVLLQMFSQVLERWNHRVETALSGQSAMSMLTEKDYDLIIMDYRMPDIDGRELYLWLKDRKPHLASRVLLMTGDTVSAETQAFLNESELTHLTKPFSLQDARTLISHLLGSEPNGRAPESPHG